MNELSTKLSALLAKGGIKHTSCFLGGMGTCHVVCRSEATARKASLVLSQSGFRIRGLTKSVEANKVQKGTRLIELHMTYTVHAMVSA